MLNNKEEAFKPGMFVEGKVKGITLNKEQVLAIPSSAVLWTGKRSVVYIKVNPAQPVFEMREITIGNQIGDNYEVLDGLNNGDEIVTNGTFTVDAAAQLQGKKSMMNKEGGKVMTGHEGHLGVEANNSSANVDRSKINMIDLSFGVRGNCSLCKTTIEAAANSVEGVTIATWDVKKKKIEVSFDDTKTNAMAIHKAIAASGYDTEKVSGSDTAYQSLPDCCQYDHDMAMNQSGEMKADDHSNHDHLE